MLLGDTELDSSQSDLPFRLFGVLKQMLKAKGISYRELADKMGLSEPTIKRLFQERDCKLSRMLEVCDALGVSLADLMKLEEQVQVEPTLLPLELEKALAQQEGLMSFFLLLVTDFDAQTIAEHNQLTEVDCYRYLRELEKLELLRLGPERQVRLLVSKPIRWRTNGPLQQRLVEINQRFAGESLRNSDHIAFYSTSRMMSEASAQRLSEEIDQLYKSFQKQASLDQAFYPKEKLAPYKMLVTMSPFDLASYFRVPPFPAAGPLRASNPR